MWRAADRHGALVMVENRSGDSVLRRVLTLAGTDGGDDVPDAELLGRFAATGDGAAFAALVRRHQRMVLGVCRHTLGHEQDAEDAFQATFLVLARKPRSVRKAQSVAAWLHGVAYHVATRARRAAARRRRHEAEAGAMTTRVSEPVTAWREIQALVDEEVRRLPDPLRTAFVLCCLEGESIASAALRLDWKPGTVAGRLARARDLLRERLNSRGVSLSAALTLAALAPEASAVPAELARNTVAAGIQLAAGESALGVVSAEVLALSEGVGKTMTASKLVLVVAGLVVAAATACALAALGGDTPPGPRGDGPRPGDGPKAATVAPELEAPVTLTGRVVGSDGKPGAGVPVAVLGTDREDRLSAPIATTKSDQDGKFSLKLTRPGPASFAPEARLLVLAGGPGHGLAWQRVQADALTREVSLRLPAEQVLRGRVLDLQGKPAKGVPVRVARVGRGDGTPPLLTFPDSDETFGGCRPAAETDAEGRFTLHGVGADLATVRAKLFDDRFGPHTLDFRPNNLGKDEPQVVAEPARILEGVVTRAGTGEPVPGARVSTVEFPQRAGGPTVYATAVTDAKGGYRLKAPLVERYSLHAFPPPGVPLLGRTAAVVWPRGQTRHTASVALNPAAALRGTVTDGKPGKPVSGATVRFLPFDSEAGFDSLQNLEFGNDLDRTAPTAASGPDGSFVVVVPPGRNGHLAVLGPTRDFIEEVTPWGRVEKRSRDPARGLRTHALIAVDEVKAGEAKEVAVTLRRGVTLRGRLLDPDGRPVEAARMLSELNLGYRPGLGLGVPVAVRGGEFELRGCDPEGSYRVYFLDTESKTGAAVTLKGADTKPVTVRLEPCGRAVVSVKDFLGRAARLRGDLELVVGPGPYRRAVAERDVVERGETYAEDIDFNRLGPPGKFRTEDKDGGVIFDYLIPGAPYRLAWIVVGKDGGVRSSENQELVVKSGETRKVQITLPED
jgi:RNA polymerase sigma factor (sigma-70 family)